MVFWVSYRLVLGSVETHYTSPEALREAAEDEINLETREGEALVPP